MDLDLFDDIDVGATSSCGDGALTTQQALRTFDNQWYARTYRSARWMDLLGDYASSELFIIDG